ncbi:unnamed protein product [Auanema sp. JU1783]|nr:unnamed protein product [Auanema sp. JU1783]
MWSWVYFLSFCSLSLAQSNYEGHKIVRVIPADDNHMRVLRDMGGQLGYELDFIRNIHNVGRPGDLIVAPENLDKTLNYLNDAQVPNEILVNNFERVVRRERRALGQAPNEYEDDPTLIGKKYLPFDKQMEILGRIVARNPRKTRLEQIGVSTEGRPIKAIWIGYPSNRTKTILWIDAGIHAREWIAPATAMYAIWHLVNDKIYTTLLHHIDIVIVPNVNPDGYEYSRLHERLWRKTRSKTGAVTCYGVDANRNFPFHFGQEGVSNQSCSEIYCGTNAESEPEVRAVVNALRKYSSRIGGYLTLHSYGQDILYPWGHTANRTEQYPPDVADLVSMGNRMAAAIRSVNGTIYTVTNSGSGFYPASGASDDWAKSIGIKYSYTIELSPRTSYYGFELPNNFIERVARETLKGMLELGKSFVKKTKSTTGEILRAKLNDGEINSKLRSQGRQG